MQDELNSMVNCFKDHGLVFWYNGPISQFLVVEIGNIIKSTMDKSSDRKVVNRLFSILVEQMQNVIKYSISEFPESTVQDNYILRSGLVAVGMEEDFYSVICGNTIRNSDIDRIGGRLDRIISMDKKAQKDYYKEMRKKEPDEKSLGAGLGFIEMARKASKPLEYSFTSIDENYSYFAIKAQVHRE